MGVGFTLVNNTRAEYVWCGRISGDKKQELTGNPVSAAITSWYLLEHMGERISFVSDTYDDWPFDSGTKKDLRNYKDVTESVVASLVKIGILKDSGKHIFDENEPEVYSRLLRNIW